MYISINLKCISVSTFDSSLLTLQLSRTNILRENQFKLVCCIFINFLVVTITFLLAAVQISCITRRAIIPINYFSIFILLTFLYLLSKSYWEFIIFCCCHELLLKVFDACIAWSCNNVVAYCLLSELEGLSFCEYLWILWILMNTSDNICLLLFNYASRCLIFWI